MVQVATESDESEHEIIDMLRDSAVSFSTGNLEVSRLRELHDKKCSFDKTIWREMCELGWVGITVPENLGGLGLSATCLGVVARELGKVVAPEPLIEVSSAATLLSYFPENQDLLLKVITGELLLSCGLVEAGEYIGTKEEAVDASSVPGGYQLNGQVYGISSADLIDGYIVCADLKKSLALFYVERDCAGLSLHLTECADGTYSGKVTLDNVQLDETSLLAAGDSLQEAIDHVRDQARVMTSAYLVGLAENVFDITIDYLKVRKQFGSAIGSFQALQHRAVDLFIQKSLASAVVDEVLSEFEQFPNVQDRLHASSRAKYRSNEAALLITREAVQMHGGMGYTEECDVGLYVNRALVLSAKYGNSSFLVEKFCDSSAMFPSEVIESDGSVLEEGLLDTNEQNWDAMDDEKFRSVVRNFFESEYPTEMRYPSKRPRWNQIKFWYLKLSEKGWVAPAWPTEHGGMGLSPAKMLIFIEEQERCGIGRSPDMGIQMVGPLLIKHGTADQRARYLPKILAGEEVWCQGYSEPNAGSDLASLKTEAIANGDEFIINGQKTWTTLAQDASHMFCLARTSKEGKPQEGISFFLIDLDQPGVTIRPIKNLAGDEEFCEVFLDDVRVPADCLVGAINEGWAIAKALLSFERIFIGSPKQSQYAVKRLEVLAKASGVFQKNTFREKLTRLKLNVLDLESTYQQFADIVRRGDTLGPDVSLLKIWGTETFARLSELMVETAGAEGASIGKIAFGDTEVDVMSQFYNARPATIYGGSNEIQRNIIAKGVLNLPKN